MGQNYVIYTDASFDDATKLGTYAAIVMQGESVIKVIAKKSKIKVCNSLECEILGIYHAINLILSCYFNKNYTQQFQIITDCINAKNFFTEKTDDNKLFLEEKELIIMMKQLYERLKKKLPKEGYSFELKWLPRNLNKIAHRYSYMAFKKLKEHESIPKNEVLVFEKRTFLEIINNFDKKQIQIINYLFNNSNCCNLILKTQKQISKSLNIPISTINKVLNELIELNVIEKMKNGRYALVV